MGRIGAALRDCAHRRALISAFVLILLLTMMGAVAARADVWRLDPNHTDIRVSWDHLGLSRQSARMTDVFGRLTFSPTNPAEGAVDVTMLVSGLTSGVAALDEVLKSPDYFDAAQFPRITFKSVAIEPMSDRAGRITGDLTIRGVTQRVQLETTWNFTGEHPLAPYNPVHRGTWVSGFTATTTINRSAFGLTRAAPLVSDQVQITINAEFIRVD